MNSQLLFDTKIKKVVKSNLETQQHRFLASSINNLTVQSQKSTYTAKPRQPSKFSRPKQNHSYRSKNQSQLLFDNKIKKVVKSNLETQQHRFLASSINNLTVQPQKSTYMAKKR